MAIAEERDDIRRIRRSAANLSMFLAYISIILTVLSVMDSGVTMGKMVPVDILLILGGAAGIGVYLALDLTVSRWFTLWSAVLTAAGIGALAIVGGFSN